MNVKVREGGNKAGFAMNKINSRKFKSLCQVTI